MTTAARPVKQGEIEAVLGQRLEVETLKRQLKRAEEELLKSELLLIYAVKSGRATQPGELSLGVNVVPGRRVPHWKEEFARVAGPEAVDQVIAATAPSAPTDKLVIFRKGTAVKGAE